MCGIIGCWLQRPLTDIDIKQMQHMRDMLAHRGPNDKGEFIDASNGIYLGHRRLSILDLDKRSAQPMARNDQILTYNGEIYNYREIKTLLEPDFNFTTESDTEVLLNAWKKWGPECLDRFDGMFAFALKKQNNLHLVTDPFGEKPIYLYKHNDGYYFASEATPLIQTFNLKPLQTAELEQEFLNLGFLQSPSTGFKNLSYLPPASHYTITKNGDLKSRTYWSPPPPEQHKGSIQPLSNKTIDTIRDILCHSLEKRLRADVPVGLFLSGGIDSTLIAAIAKKELGYDLNTYTVTFPDGADEIKYAQDIAKHLNLNHTCIDSNENDLWKETPKNLLNMYGTPIDNTTAFAIQQMCSSAKKHLTVALSGLGGDEFFYGYNKYQMFYNHRLAYNLSPFIQPILPILQRLPVKKLQTASTILKGCKQQQYLKIKNSGTHKNGNFPLKLNTETDLTYAAQQFDIKQTMPSNLIPAIDRSSMRASVEVRTPFLNRDLLNYCATLDQRALIHFGKKSATRTLLARYINLDMLTPNKQGFVFPISRYFAHIGQSIPPEETVNELRRLIWNEHKQR